MSEENEAMDGDNPIVKTAQQAKAHEASSGEVGKAGKRKPLTKNAKIAAGAAVVGVGSAALVAALLYVNKGKK